MIPAARKAGQQIARTIAQHTRNVSERAVERRSNDRGEVVKSDGKGRVTIYLPGVGIPVTETDIDFTFDPASLQVGDSVPLLAVDNEYIALGVTGDQTTTPKVTGSKGGNAALGSLIKALTEIGLITDETT